MRRRRGLFAGLAAAALLALTAGSAAAQNEAVVDRLDVPAQPQTEVTGSTVLKAGVRYRIVVTGFSTITSGADHGSHDAMYCFDSSAGPCVEPFPDSTAIVFGPRPVGAVAPNRGSLDGIEDFGEGDGTILPYDAGHRYEQRYTPLVDSNLYVVAMACCHVSEGIAYSGSFTVTVSIVDSAGGPPVPVDCSSAAAPVSGADCAPTFGRPLAVDLPAAGGGFVANSPTVPAKAKGIGLTATATGAPGTRPAAVTTAQIRAGAELLQTCLFFGAIATRQPDKTVVYGTSEAVLLACIRLLGEEAGSRAERTAAGCPVRVVALPLRGQTAKQRRRAVRKLRRVAKLSCTRSSTDTLRLRLEARGRRARLRALTGKQLRIAVAPTAAPTAPAGPEARLVLTWRR